MKMTKLAAVAALSVSVLAAMPAQAKTVSAGTTIKKAKTVKKGVTTIKQKKATDGYVKFKATATKTYKFTFNKLRCSGNFQNVYSHADLKTGKYNRNISFKQNGEKVSSIYLTTARNWNTSTNKKKTAFTNLPSRTVSVKLKKNQVVYIYHWAASSGKTVYYNLTIK